MHLAISNNIEHATSVNQPYIDKYMSCFIWRVCVEVNENVCNLGLKTDHRLYLKTVNVVKSRHIRRHEILCLHIIRRESDGNSLFDMRHLSLFFMVWDNRLIAYDDTLYDAINKPAMTNTINAEQRVIIKDRKLYHMAFVVGENRKRSGDSHNIAVLQWDIILILVYRVVVRY